MLRTLNDFVDRQDLLDQVLNQIAQDISNQDFTAIEEMIKRLPDQDLISYLPGD